MSEAWPDASRDYTVNVTSRRTLAGPASDFSNGAQANAGGSTLVEWVRIPPRESGRTLVHQLSPTAIGIGSRRSVHRGPRRMQVGLQGCNPPGRGFESRRLLFKAAGGRSSVVEQVHVSSLSSPRIAAHRRRKPEESQNGAGGGCRRDYIESGGCGCEPRPGDGPVAQPEKSTEVSLHHLAAAGRLQKNVESLLTLAENEVSSPLTRFTMQRHLPTSSR